MKGNTNPIINFLDLLRGDKYCLGVSVKYTNDSDPLMLCTACAKADNLPKDLTIKSVRLVICGTRCHSCKIVLHG